MEGVRESESQVGQGEAEEEVEEEVEEEEERKSLVSSTHLSSSEYSARIGKEIQSDGCSLPPWPYKAGCFRSVAMAAAAHSYLAVRGNCLGHSHRDVDANTHTYTYSAIRVNPYLPPPTRKQKYNREKKKENEIKDFTHVHSSQVIGCETVWLPPTQTTTLQLLLAHAAL